MERLIAALAAVEARKAEIVGAVTQRVDHATQEIERQLGIDLDGDPDAYRRPLLDQAEAITRRKLKN